jgi:hypothetical protein
MSDLQQQQEPEYDFLLAEARSITDTSLKDERLAKQLDDRLAQIQGIPAGYLSTRRMMGELRNPYGGRFQNQSVQMALIKAATYDPSVGQLQQFLAAKAGVTLPAPDYAAQARAEQNARWEEEMRQWAEQTRANRQKALGEYSAMLQQGTPKTPAHIRYVGPGGGGI